MPNKERAFAAFLDVRKKANNYRSLNDIAANDGHEITVLGRNYVNFSGNDYLGLSQHPALIKAAQNAAAKYGAGAGASRLVTGNTELFTVAENKIAKLKGKEAALIMVSGFQANASILPALFDKTVHGCEPLVFTDKLNHASMHLGCAAAGIKQIRYAHNDMNHLETLLRKHTGHNTPKFILCESVFSMDGDIAPLDDIASLAKKYDAFVICDEAHATGLLGENGSGLAHSADLVIGTFSKAMGSFGAYVACSKIMKEYLINKCAGLIYATALPPAVLGSINAALDIVPAMDAQRAHVANIAAQFRNGIKALGYDTGASATQIVPVIIGDSKLAIEMSDALKEQGYWATAIRPPTVPEGSARIRFAFSASHTEDDIENLIGAFKALRAKDAA